MLMYRLIDSNWCSIVVAAEVVLAAVRFGASEADGTVSRCKQ
jgi:hypothetical protein